MHNAVHVQGSPDLSHKDIRAEAEGIQLVYINMPGFRSRLHQSKTSLGSGE